MKRNGWMSLMAVAGALAAGPLIAQMGPQQGQPQQDQQMQRDQGTMQSQEIQREQSQEMQRQQLGQEQSQQKPWADQQASLDAVRDLQQQLKDQGYYQDGNVDGLVGPKTESALREFQQAQGLDPTGEINAETLAAMGIDRSEFAAFGVEEEQMDRPEQQQPGSEQEMEQGSDLPME